MRDQMDSRIWIEHGPAFTAGIAGALAAIASAFAPALKRLHEIEFSAPWKQRSHHA